MSIVWHITDNTAEFKAGFERGIKAGLEAVGQQAERDVKELTPTGESYEGHTGGTLKNKITHEVRGESVFVGSPTKYSPYVELGHHQKPGRYVPRLGKRLKKSWVDPRPFLKPGIMSGLGQYKELLEMYIKMNLP